MISMTKPAADALLLEIARTHFPSIETLETRNSDGLDFHDVAVWAIRSAYVGWAEEQLSHRQFLVVVVRFVVLYLVLTFFLLS